LQVFIAIVPEDSRELTPGQIIASDLEGLNISPYVKVKHGQWSRKLLCFSMR